jgi:hypothetical protein
MNNINSLYKTFSTLALLTSLATISSCVSTVENATGEDQQQGVGILIFGDSGYHPDYPDQEDYVEMFTAEGFVEAERQDWIDDKRPMDEFEPRPTMVSPVTGRVTAATGMYQISIAMRNYCRDTVTCDFGVMLGDNIYPSGATLGTDGHDDDQRFHDILGAPFGNIVDSPDSYLSYVVLGNHDYETSRDGGFAEIAYLEKADGFYMDGPFYSVKPPVGNGDIELFIIDTSMMLAASTVYEDVLNDDASENPTGIIEHVDYFVEPLTEAERNMHVWLDDALRKSTAKWKFVVGHHPIWSSSGSKFEQARALRKLILPSMCRYADAYFVGHEHTLELHIDSCEAALGSAASKPLVQVLSGAAAQQRPTNSTFSAHQQRKYPELSTKWALGLVWGFAHMQVEGDLATVTFLSVPDDGGSETTVEFEYQFERRSHLNHAMK